MKKACLIAIIRHQIKIECEKNYENNIAIIYFYNSVKLVGTGFTSHCIRRHIKIKKPHYCILNCGTKLVWHEKLQKAYLKSNVWLAKKSWGCKKLSIFLPSIMPLKYFVSTVERSYLVCIILNVSFSCDKTKSLFTS